MFLNNSRHNNGGALSLLQVTVEFSGTTLFLGTVQMKMVELSMLLIQLFTYMNW